MRLRRAAAIGAAIAATALPVAAWAHPAERGLILLLPTGYYLAGGAAAVAISFAVLALAPAGWRWRRAPRRRLHVALPQLARVLQWAVFAVFALLVISGFVGSRDPLANPLTLGVWTVWWIGFTLAVAVVGDLWPVLNPWSAPVRLARRLVGPPALRMPSGAGYWPALAGLAAFVWFESVDIAPTDPARLARAAALYWLAQFVAMLLVGERRWRARGETFSVAFRLIGRVSALHWTPRGVALAWPGERLARAPALPLPGWVFVTSLIASVSFDGLSGTFAWLALLGINPLEFPGRSAVVAENTAGLFGVWLALAAAYATAVAAGHRLAGGGADIRAALGRTALSLVPIAVAYHFAHYLALLLVNGQYALVAATDPLGTGADWLGLGPWHVTTSFLNDFDVVETLWQVQTAAIVGGHLMAVAVAHAIALDLHGGRRRAAVSQLPLAALMVGLTALGLWLLSAPAGV